jgi:hypothetical protein
MPNACCCQTCVWWDSDARRVTISAPCRITHVIHRPADTCAQHAPHRGPHALDPVLVRLTR